MKINKHILITFVACIILGVPWLINKYPQSMNFIDGVFYYVNNNYAAVFLNKSITVNDLHNKYGAVADGNPKVRILIVPGHEPDFGGTEYKNLKERDLNVELAKKLEEFLKRNDHYEAIIARDNKSWNTDLENYFTNNWKDIIAFFKQRKENMIHLVNSGEVKKAPNGVKHNAAPQNVALRLYGINKWVNENKVDIAIHIHFNDYPRSGDSSAGKYSGLSIYVPERQYSNSTTTRVIAEAVFNRLSKYNAVSNLPKEENGVNEDQDLIAIGSYNTLDAPSMLIEYGYIYEPQFADAEVRDAIFKDLAFQTYLGLQDFFGGPNDVSVAYDTLMLPYDWKDTLKKNGTNNNKDVLALQTALLLEGVYPGDGKTKNDCPITGKFGACTAEAVSQYQKKYGITGESGVAGSKTLRSLNGEYSLNIR